MQQEFKRFTQNLKQQNNIQVTANSIDLQLNGTLQLNQIDVNFPTVPTPLKIETFKLGNLYHFSSPQQFPATAQLSAQTLQWQIPPTANNSPSWLSLLGYGTYQLSDRELNALGYDTVRGDLDVTFNSQADTVMLHATFKTPHLGNLTADLKLLNVPPPNQWQPQAVLALTQKIQLAEFKLQYQQTETFSRVLNFIAQRNSVDKQQLRQTLLTQLNNDLSRLHFPLTNELITQLTRLFNQAGTMTLSLTPAKPVNLNRLFSNSLAENGLKITE